jgi:hypothetical protein
MAGDTVLTIERPVHAVAVPDSVRASAIQNFQREGYTAEGGFNPEDVPRVYPPLERLDEATDGRLWVWRRGDGGVQMFDVFSPDGEYLATAEAPVGFDRMSITTITDKNLYGLERGEFDIPYVIRLRIRELGDG